VSAASVSADGVTVDGPTARLAGVRASLSDPLGRSSSAIIAAPVSGSGTVPFSSVRSRLPSHS